MKKRKKIQWHQGFYSGMELELREYSDILEFETEHELSRKPLRIDMLIIRVKEDVEIRNSIGAFFRKHNIIEYKSPHDKLNIDDLYKIIGYAGIYKSLGEKTNSIRAEDMTLSVFRHVYPRDLMKELRESGISVIQEAKGIFRLQGVFYIPIRIIVTSKLGPEHAFLRVLTDCVSKEDAKGFLKIAGNMETPGDKNNAAAVLEVTTVANGELYYGGLEDGIMSDEVLEILMGDRLVQRDLENVRKGEKQGREQGIEQGIEQGEELLLSAITKIKAGKTAADLSREGVNPRTIERAMKCI